ncbi:TetR/AcrR family transcriptional regulator [Micromonospora sp. NBC_00362]|uniref:TetR/AcrR family transcriptional regulator n=1 Tax=Micromonospora sp. NBC_00362 TaxID=2975975 RepID=UPI002258428B|nr:TetR family transcriptional regulator [Micromonospora sp. NBC_00362]MCX5121956.1 TetR/AcrR family transcriptional regulator [Micromonospora sp. NBC_00362]
MTGTRATRRKRANGVESRQRILDAAVQIASERGYEGTSIAAVSARCGLPASSIYWHFKDKDDLLAAVIERSFETWLAAVDLPGEEIGTPLQRFVAVGAAVAASLVNAPDFLRLGLMLALERRPEEPRGRAVFLQVREVARQKFIEMIETLLPDLDPGDVRTVVTYALAGADGLFLQREIHGDAVDLAAMFELHARLVYEAALRMAPGASHDHAKP